jgi:hypothetical protein
MKASLLSAYVREAVLACDSARATEDDMSELNRLRCQLRAVNIEYSELVRRKRAEVTYGRMAGLRSERYLLMALIAAEWQETSS